MIHSRLTAVLALAAWSSAALAQDLSALSEPALNTPSDANEDATAAEVTFQVIGMKKTASGAT